MEISYDAAADAAYIQLAETIDAGGVDRTYSCDPGEIGGMVNIDLDVVGRIVGIEVLTASALLPTALLAKTS